MDVKDNTGGAVLIPRKLENSVSVINTYLHPRPHREFYLNRSWQAFHVEDEAVSALGLWDQALAITITQLFPAAGRKTEMAY